MAIKEQCSNCKSFNGDVCLLTNVMPDYNQTSCEQYARKGIVLDKGNSHVSPIITPPTSNSSEAETKPVKQRMFSHPFSFKGRIRRLEYVLSYILMYAYAILMGFIVGASGGSEGLMYFLLIPAYWLMWAQGAKRCHDRGNSGWYQLIPFYGLWMLFGDGDEFDNIYGSDPKGRKIYN